MLHRPAPTHVNPPIKVKVWARSVTFCAGSYLGGNNFRCSVVFCVNFGLAPQFRNSADLVRFSSSGTVLFHAENATQICSHGGNFPAFFLSDAAGTSPTTLPLGGGGCQIKAPIFGRVIRALWQSFEAAIIPASELDYRCESPTRFPPSFLSGLLRFFAPVGVRLPFTLPVVARCMSCNPFLSSLLPPILYFKFFQIF